MFLRQELNKLDSEISNLKRILQVKSAEATRIRKQLNQKQSTPGIATDLKTGLSGLKKDIADDLNKIRRDFSTWIERSFHIGQRFTNADDDVRPTPVFET
jgi:hypothetical protein